MITREDLQHDLQNANVRAFAAIVRYGESSNNPDAYHLRFPSKRFDSLAAHPHIMEPIPGSDLKSSAAGAYQATWTTWNEGLGIFSWPDFSEQCQDEFFVWRLIARGALTDLIEGKLDSAIARCRKEWTSLPGAAASRYTLEFARSLFTQSGGTLSSVPPPVVVTKEAAPVDERRKDMGPELILGLGNVLINMFSPWLKEKITQRMEQHTDNPEVAQQIANAIVDKAQSITGASDPVQAVAMIQNDPTKVETLQTSVNDSLEKMTPIFDQLAAMDKDTFADEEASRAAAAARARVDAFDMTPYLLMAASAVMLLIVVGLVIGLGFQIVTSSDHEPSPGLLGLAGPILMAAVSSWSELFKYRFGASRGQNAQTALVAQLATRK